MPIEIDDVATAVIIQLGVLRGAPRLVGLIQHPRSLLQEFKVILLQVGVCIAGHNEKRHGTENTDHHCVDFASSTGNAEEFSTQG